MAGQSRTDHFKPDGAIIRFDQPTSIAYCDIQIGKPARTLARREYQRVERTEAQFVITVRSEKTRVDQGDAADLRHAQAVAQLHDDSLGGKVRRIRIAKDHV